jgi:hypothetical protein
MLLVEIDELPAMTSTKDSKYNDSDSDRLSCETLQVNFD